VKKFEFITNNSYDIKELNIKSMEM